MKVLVMGGTRFNGLALVEELVKHGHAVTLFNRGASEAAVPPGVRRLYGDRHDHTALRAALGDETFDTGSGADVIIFNVGDGNDLVTGFDAALDCVQMASEFIDWVLPQEDLFARHITKLDDGSLLLTFTQESLSPKNTTFAEFRYAPIFT